MLVQKRSGNLLKALRTSNHPTCIIKQIPKAVNIKIGNHCLKRYLIIVKNSVMKPNIIAVIKKKELASLETKKHYNNCSNILENHITDNNMNMSDIMNRNNNRNKVSNVNLATRWLPFQ